MDKSLVLWIFGIIISIDTAFIVFLVKEYLNFRFHLAENYVLRKDYREDISKIFTKFDELNKQLRQIFERLAGAEKTDRGG